MVGLGAASILSWAACLLLRRDARRLRAGALLLLAILSTTALLDRLLLRGRPTAEVLLQVAAALGLSGALVLGVTVVVGSLAVSRTESRLRGRVLSGLGGLALLLSPWVPAALAGAGSPLGLGAAVIAGTIAITMGLTYLVFLGAAVLHHLLPRPREGTGIIILGSTLRDGRVPPLLRRRLERAVVERGRLLDLGIDPLLVPSGGKGDAENPAESEAMADHLLRVLGVPADRVRAETEARTTEENLILSHRLLDDAGHQGPYIVSTSGYHTFRAGLLARGLGFDDAVIGGPTALSYLPTATLREFVLTMSYRKRWIAASLPVTAGLVTLLLRAA